MNTESNQKNVNFFTDQEGLLSMRRLISFLFALTTIGAIPLNIVYGSEWKMCLISVGLPLAGSLLMMFFTSWSDIACVAKAIKKGE